MRKLLFLFPLLFLLACGGPVTKIENPDANDDASAEEALPGDALFVDQLSGDLLKLFMINIGQGDSFLIQTPGGKNILVDAGPGKGKKRLVNFLKAQNIEGLDLMILTHPDEDHIGGAPAVIEAMPVKLILDNGYVKPTPPYEQLIAAAEAKAIPIKSAKIGRNIKVESGIEFEILAPAEQLFSGTRSDANANTIVFRFVYGDISFYFAGDSEMETEQLVLSQGKDVHATIYKVAHHGSRYANQNAMLDAISPQIALISAGKNNRFGHPTPEVVARLQERKVRIFSTIDLGHVGIATDGTHLMLDTTKRDHIALFQGVGQKIGDLPAFGEGEDQEPVVKVNVNKATEAELVKVRGVGAKLAAKIIETREAIGGFKTFEDLRKVPGVGKKKLIKLKQLLILEDAPAPAAEDPQTNNCEPFAEAA